MPIATVPTASITAYPHLTVARRPLSRNVIRPLATSRTQSEFAPKSKTPAADIATAIMATMLPVTVMGIGVRESVLVYLLSPRGVESSSAVALSFLVMAAMHFRQNAPE